MKSNDLIIKTDIELMRDHAHYCRLTRELRRDKLTSWLGFTGIFLGLLTVTGHAFTDGIYRQYGLNFALFPQDAYSNLFSGISILVHFVTSYKIWIFLIIFSVAYAFKLVVVGGLWSILQSFLAIVRLPNTNVLATPLHDENRGLARIELNLMKAKIENIGGVTLKSHQSLILILGIFLASYTLAFNKGVEDAKTGKAFKDQRDVSVIQLVNGRQVHLIGKIIACSEDKCAVAYGVNNVSIAGLGNSDFMLP
jgi:hypothetical protein